jgi:hypothetical protein
VKAAVKSKNEKFAIVHQYSEIAIQAKNVLGNVNALSKPKSPHLEILHFRLDRTF